MIVCGDVSTQRFDDTLVLSADIASNALPRALRFEIPSEIDATPDTETPNWLIAALLYPAMMLGQDLHVDAAVSGQLLNAVNHDIQDLLVLHDPRLTRINVSAERSVDHRCKPSTGVATGFSAGIDSFATIALYTDHVRSETMSLTHLAMFDVGALGHTAQRSPIFEKYLERTIRYASTRNFKVLALRSNIDDFFDTKILGVTRKFQKTHTLRHLAAALVFSGEMTHYLYSAAYPYSSIKVDESKDIAKIDPILVPLFSTGALSFLSAGGGLSRVEKTRMAAERVEARHLLDVCVRNAERRVSSRFINCGTCWKCGRTLLTLEALGRLDDFRGVFDVSAYQEKRARILRGLVERAREGDEVDAEALEFARSQRVQVPWYPRGLQALAQLRRRARAPSPRTSADGTGAHA